MAGVMSYGGVENALSDIRVRRVHCGNGVVDSELAEECDGGAGCSVLCRCLSPHVPFSPAQSRCDDITFAPTRSPTTTPSAQPTRVPTKAPTPANAPTSAPTRSPAPGVPEVWWGSLSNVGETEWELVNFTVPFSTTPVIVCTPFYTLAHAPAAIRLRNIDTDSFEIRGYWGTLPAYTVDRTPLSEVQCMAITPGLYILEGGQQLIVDTFVDDAPAETGQYDSAGRRKLVTFDIPFSVAPGVFGQTQTTNDETFSTFWCRGAGAQKDPPDADSFSGGHQVGAHPDNTKGAETIGYFAMEPGLYMLGPTLHVRVGLSAQTLKSLEDGPFSLATGGGVSAVDVALITQQGMNGGDGRWAVGYQYPDPTTLYAAVDEEQFSDEERKGTTERVAFLIGESVSTSAPTLRPTESPLPPGATLSPTAAPTPTPGFQLSVYNGVLDADVWEQFNLTSYYAEPVVFCSTRYTKTHIPALVRVRNVASYSFEATVQWASAGAYSETTEAVPVQCLVAERGVWTAHDGRIVEVDTFLASATASKGKYSTSGFYQTVNFLSTFSQAPVVLGQLQTFNDARQSQFWASDPSAMTSALTATGMRTGKNIGADPDTTRVAEWAGYIAMEPGVGYLTESLFVEAGYTDQSVLSMDDGAAPYVHPLSGLLSTVTAAFVTQRSMVGGDGRWVVQVAPATPTELYLVADEDQYDDEEREGAIEFASYLVVEELDVPGSVPTPGPPQPSLAEPAFVGLCDNVAPSWCIADDFENVAVDLTAPAAADYHGVDYYPTSNWKLRLSTSYAGASYLQETGNRGVDGNTAQRCLSVLPNLLLVRGTESWRDVDVSVWTRHVDMKGLGVAVRFSPNLRTWDALVMHVATDACTTLTHRALGQTTTVIGDAKAATGFTVQQLSRMYVHRLVADGDYYAYYIDDELQFNVTHANEYPDEIRYRSDAVALLTNKMRNSGARFDNLRVVRRGCGNWLVEADRGEQCDTGSGCTSECLCDGSHVPYDPPRRYCFGAPQPTPSPAPVPVEAHPCDGYPATWCFFDDFQSYGKDVAPDSNLYSVLDLHPGSGASVSKWRSFNDDSVFRYMRETSQIHGGDTSFDGKCLRPEGTLLIADSAQYFENVDMRVEVRHGAARGAGIVVRLDTQQRTWLMFHADIGFGCANILQRRADGSTVVLASVHTQWLLTQYNNPERQFHALRLVVFGTQLFAYANGEMVANVTVDPYEFSVTSGRVALHSYHSSGNGAQFDNWVARRVGCGNALLEVQFDEECDGGLGCDAVACTCMPGFIPTTPLSLACIGAPSLSPTQEPTNMPSAMPTRAPSRTPSRAPSPAPSQSPTPGPTTTPGAPSRAPTLRPTNAPSTVPTRAPTRAPSTAPSRAPTAAPTPPTEAPTLAPVYSPTPFGVCTGFMPGWCFFDDFASAPTPTPAPTAKYAVHDFYPGCGGVASSNWHLREDYLAENSDICGAGTGNSLRCTDPQGTMLAVPSTKGWYDVDVQVAVRHRDNDGAGIALRVDPTLKNWILVHLNVEVTNCAVVLHSESGAQTVVGSLVPYTVPQRAQATALFELFDILLEGTSLIVSVNGDVKFNGTVPAPTATADGGQVALEAWRMNSNTGANFDNLWIVRRGCGNGRVELTVEECEWPSVGCVKETCLCDAPTYKPRLAVPGECTIATDAPTMSPTPPTEAPTLVPSRTPTRAPSDQPTRAPTFAPTHVPTKLPTRAPTHSPTLLPSRAPTTTPTRAPTRAPRESTYCNGAETFVASNVPSSERLPATLTPVVTFYGECGTPVEIEAQWPTAPNTARLRWGSFWLGVSSAGSRKRALNLDQLIDQSEEMYITLEFVMRLHQLWLTNLDDFEQAALVDVGAPSTPAYFINGSDSQPWVAPANANITAFKLMAVDGSAFGFVRLETRQIGTRAPTLSPTNSPTLQPSVSPTALPTLAPTQSPTMATNAPTLAPTVGVANIGGENGLVDDVPWWAIAAVGGTFCCCILLIAIVFIVTRRQEKRRAEVAAAAATELHELEEETLVLSSPVPVASDAKKMMCDERGETVSEIVASADSVDAASALELVKSQRKKRQKKKAEFDLAATSADKPSPDALFATPTKELLAARAEEERKRKEEFGAKRSRRKSKSMIESPVRGMYAEKNDEEAETVTVGDKGRKRAPSFYGDPGDQRSNAEAPRLKPFVELDPGDNRSNMEAPNLRPPVLNDPLDGTLRRKKMSEAAPEIAQPDDSMMGGLVTLRASSRKKRKPRAGKAKGGLSSVPEEPVARREPLLSESESESAGSSAADSFEYGPPCTQCGTPTLVGAKFCGKCRARLDDVQEAPAAAVHDDNLDTLTRKLRAETDKRRDTLRKVKRKEGDVEMLESDTKKDEESAVAEAKTENEKGEASDFVSVGDEKEWAPVEAAAADGVDDFVPLEELEAAFEDAAPDMFSDNEFLDDDEPVVSTPTIFETDKELARPTTSKPTAELLVDDALQPNDSASMGPSSAAEATDGAGVERTPGAVIRQFSEAGLLSEHGRRMMEESAAAEMRELQHKQEQEEAEMDAAFNDIDTLMLDLDD